MKDPAVTRGPMSPVWGSWDLATKQRPDKKKTAPIFTEQRGIARWDGLKQKDREEIAERAKEAAAQIMREFSERTGR